MKYLHEVDNKYEKKYVLIALIFHILIISTIVYFKNSSDDKVEQQLSESSLSDNGDLSDSDNSLNQEFLDIAHEKELERLESEKLNANAVSSAEVNEAVKTFNDNIKKEEQRKVDERIKIENERIELVKKEKKEKLDKINLEKKQKRERIESEKKEKDRLNKLEQDKKLKKEQDRIKKENDQKQAQAQEKERLRIEKTRMEEEAKRKKSIAAMKKAQLDKQRADIAKRKSMQNKGYNSNSKALSNSEKIEILKIYRDQVFNKVYSNWLRPSYSKRGWSCKAIITQDSSGTVKKVNIVNCQGDLKFQESVKRAIYKSSPLPLPRDSSLFNKTIEITFKVT